MPKQYIVRLISSGDHDISKQQLIKQIKKTGRDRYDTNRKQIFDDFYAKHNVDFFGTLVGVSDLNKSINKLKREFSTKTLGDREKQIQPDIAIVYRAEKCRMVQHVYGGRPTSDCYQFIADPRETLVEVREI